MLNSDVTILADNFAGTSEAEQYIAKVYVMTDTVIDAAVSIMKLSIKAVQGIEEPVKLISPMGFAVGATSNKIFTWGVTVEVPSYDAPAANQEENEEVPANDARLDGVEEESKNNVA